MKIALAQCKSIPGDVAANTVSHLRLIDTAVALGAEAIFFPELSLTAYEPTLAAGLVCSGNDPRLQPFADKAVAERLWIGVGVPCQEAEGVSIGMQIFQPSGQSLINAKAYLHADEEPFFCSGQHLGHVPMQGLEVALAICYEISVDEHLHQSVTKDTDLYIAAVAKHHKGMQDAGQRLSSIASKYQIPAMIVNAIGPADGMQCAGQSAVWDANGNLMGQLPPDEEGILIYDTQTGSVLLDE